MPRSGASKKFYYEPISREALKYIIEHELPNVELKGRDENLDARLRRMYSMLDQKGLKVTYSKKIKDKSGKQYGREYSTLPLSNQNLHRPFRNALVNHYIKTSGRRCVDIDVVNCHPAMFLQLLQKHNVSCSYDHIDTYVNQRKKILDEIQKAYKVEKDTAKCLLLALINFGTVKSWAYRYEVKVPNTAAKTEIHGFLMQYCKQFKACVSELMTMMPALVDVSRQTLEVEKGIIDELSLQKRFVHTLLTEGENQVLQAMIGHITKTHKNAEIISKMYDGCIVQCEEDIDCNKITSQVYESTGFWLTFEIKPFVSPITIPSDLPRAPLSMAQAVEARDDFTKQLAQVAQESGGHRTLAKMFHSMYPDRFAYLGQKDGWFSFRAPRWYHIQRDTEEIMSLINNEFSQRIDEALDVLMGEDPVDSKLIDKVQQISHTQLSRHSFKESLVKEMQSLYKIANAGAWLGQLDDDDFILGFEDLVYDFREKRFREGLPSDMITMSTGHFSYDIVRNEEREAIILKSLASMHESPEVLDYILRFLATTVVGWRPNDTYQIWTGAGRNGKGITKNLCAVTFGDYFYEPDSTIFSARGISGNCLSPELAKMKAKRLVMPSESEAGDSLRTGLVKRLTGKDLIQARCLYATPVEFRSKANIAMLFNEMPASDDSSIGFSKRTDIIPYEYIYTDNPTKPNEKLEDKQLCMNLRTKEYGATFLAYLIDLYNRVGFERKRPQAVIDATAEYLGENDVVGAFMAKHFEPSGNYGDYVPLETVWAALLEDRVYKHQINVKRSQDLSQKLKKGSGMTIKPLKGRTVIRYLKARDTFIDPASAASDDPEVDV